MQEREMAQSNMILKVVTGSRLYGTNTHDSDDDFQAIFIPNKEYVLGLKKCEQVEFHEKTDPKNIVDFTSYSLIKFIKLACDNNPNIISVLYTPEHHIQYMNYFGRELILNRHLFLSKKAKHTFLGYAYNQKHKLITKDPIGKRKEIIEKYGYDTKYGSHTIRLLHEGLEILNTHQLTYPSPERKKLMAIRYGEWSLDDVLAEINRLEQLFEPAIANSTLQHSCNIDEIEKLQIRLLERFWEEKTHN